MSSWGRQAVIWTLGLVVTFVMLGLGIWQANRFENSGQEAMVDRMVQPPRPLDEFQDPERGITEAFGLQVSVTGEFLPKDQMIAGQQAPQRVVAAFELEDGSVLPVVRGQTNDPTVSRPPEGEVELQGILLDTDPEVPRPRPTEGVVPGVGYVGPDAPLPPPNNDAADPGAPADSGSDGDVTTSDLQQLDNVRLPVIAQTWTEPMAGAYLSVDAAHSEAAGLDPVVVPIPDNAERQARNRGYSLQWWLFAAVAVVATIKLSHDAARNTGFMRRETSEEGQNDD